MSLIAWLPLTTDIKEKIQNRPVSAAAGRSLPTAEAQGKLGQGYTFSNSGIKVSDVPTTAEMSFSLWLKMTSATTGCHILDLRDSSEAGYQPIYYKPDSGIQIYSSYGGSSYVNTKFELNTWYHVIVTMKSGEGVVYINGENIGSTTGVGTNSKNSYLSIGCRCSGDNPFPGVIQDVRVYNHILSKKEIKDLNQALVLHYNFENANVSPNLFRSDEYISTIEKTRCNITPFGNNGFTFTCTDDYKDPYAGMSSPNNTGSIGDNPIVYTGDVKSICISWTHISGSELNKNYIVYLDSNRTILNSSNINFGGGIQKIGNRRYVICNLPTGTRAVHIRLGNGTLSNGDSIIIDEVCIRVGEAYTFSYPSPEGMPMNTTGLYNTTNCQNLSINNDAKQGFYSGKFNNTIIQCPFSSNGWEEFTLAAWVKPDTLYFVGNALCFIVGGLYLCMENEGKFSTYCYGKSQEGYHVSNSKLKENEWNHIAAVWSKSDVKLYLNGNLDQTINNVTGTANNATHHTKKDIGAENTTSNRAFSGLMDDVRIYASALSENDVQSLIHTKQIINNQGYEYISNMYEQDILASQITSKSIHNFNGLNEILELDDGSCWIQLSHHNCRAGTNLFSSSDDFANKFVYHNDECWSAFHLINILGKYNNTNYEFIAIEQKNNTEQFLQYRWNQTVNPLTATHSQAWTKNNYNYNTNYDQPSERGGLFRYSSGTDPHSNTFLRIANGTSSNWYGAFGAFQSWDKHNGIPGFNAETDGILDLYMRINPTEKRYREFKSGIIMPTTINEI